MRWEAKQLGHWVVEVKEGEDFKEGNDHEDGQKGIFQGTNQWNVLTLCMNSSCQKATSKPPILVASFISLLKKCILDILFGYFRSFLNPF